MRGKRVENNTNQPIKKISLCVKSGSKTVKLELYPAEQWSPRPGARPGMFRVKVGRSWDMANGKYTFYCMGAVMALAGRIVQELGEGELEINEGEPIVPSQLMAKHALVEAPDPLHGLSYAVRTMTKSFQGVDGQWHVFILGQDDPVPVSSLTILRASTRVP